MHVIQQFQIKTGIMMNSSTEKSYRKLQVTPNNKIHNKIYQLMNYLNASDEQDSEKQSIKPNQRLQNLKSLAKTQKQYYHQNLNEMNSSISELELQIKEIGKMKNRDHLTNRCVEIVSENIEGAYEDIDRNDRKLSEHYRVYRNKFLQAKISIRQNESNFRHQAENLEKTLNMKIDRLIKCASKQGRIHRSLSRIENSPGMGDWLQIETQIQKLKTKIVRQGEKLIENQQNQKFIETNITQLKKSLNMSIKKESDSLDADFQKHYSTLEQIVHSVSSKIK